MVFSGNYRYTVDAKGRVNIPAQFRNQLSEESENSFHITFGPNENLVAYPRESFVVFAARMEEKYGSLGTSEEERRYFLQTMSNAQAARCDSQGRIIVPEGHLAHANIKDEVLIIGAVSKLEFWNPATYEAFMSQSSLSDKERVQRFGGADRP